MQVLKKLKQNSILWMFRSFSIGPFVNLIDKVNAQKLQVSLKIMHSYLWIKSLIFIEITLSQMHDCFSYCQNWYGIGIVMVVIGLRMEN